MLQVVFNLSIVLAILLMIVLALVICVRALLAVWRRRQQRDARLISEIKDQLSSTGLSSAQQWWIERVVLPRLLDYRRRSRFAGGLFQVRSKSSIIYMFLGGVISTAIGSVLQGFWQWGLIVLAMLQAGAGISTAFDRVEGNSSRWRDYAVLSAAIEDALRELLTEDDRPITQRWQRFCDEWEAIGKLEQELFARRVSESQSAASSEVKAAHDNLQQIRRDYRDSKPAVVGDYDRRSDVDRIVLPKAVTAPEYIEGTNITPAEYVQRSMGGFAEIVQTEIDESEIEPETSSL